MAITRREPPVMGDEATRRFWAKVDKRGPDDCWLWTACRYPRGYGKVGITQGSKAKTFYAHRIAFLLTTGEWPPVVLHAVCDRPPCCNSNHLRGGTDADNKADCVAKKRHAHGDTHGHCKLTEAKVRDIRYRYAAGVNQKQLARENGIVQPLVSLIVTRRIWRHVD